MPPKKITVANIGGVVKLSSDIEYKFWLQRQGVVALIDTNNSNCQQADNFASLQDGGAYRMGPPIRTVSFANRCPIALPL